MTRNRDVRPFEDRIKPGSGDGREREILIDGIAALLARAFYELPIAEVRTLMFRMTRTISDYLEMTPQQRRPWTVAKAPVRPEDFHEIWWVRSDKPEPWAGLRLVTLRKTRDGTTIALFHFEVPERNGPRVWDDVREREGWVMVEEVPIPRDHARQ